jgi:hypothetical protein
LYEELQEIVLNYNVHTTYNNLKNPSTEISLRRLKPKRLRHPGYIRSLIRRQEDFKVAAENGKYPVGKPEPTPSQKNGSQNRLREKESNR